jgi:predicted component of type VI protein secretion system
MKAELVPENGDPPIPITRDLVVVGRRGHCDVVIDHPSLSKRHCVLVKTDGLLVIRDLMSTNGTKVKGQRVRWAALLPDDRITLGSYKLRVYLGSDQLPAPSELYQARTGRATSPAPSGAASFPEPSPLEIEVSSSDENLAVRPPRASAAPRPLIPIELDDDDEDIIELD